MSDFRTKLLGLAALGMMFAGVSYGQVVTCPAAATAPGGNPTLRAEGETELTSDVQLLACTNTIATTGTVYAILSAPVTGKTESTCEVANCGGAAGTVFAGNSDITLVVTPNVGAATFYAGTVSGLTVTFNNVALPSTAAPPPASFTLTVQNIRVNASAASAPQITGTLLVTYAGPGGLSTNVTATTANVGYVLPSLSYALLANASGVPTITNIATCNGNPFTAGGTVLPVTNFQVNIKQLVAGAFRTQAGENGDLVAAANPPLAATTGLATQATQVAISLANVPAAATVYVPLQIAASAGGTETLQLAGSPSAATTPPAVIGAGTAGTGLVAFTPTNGTVTITYTLLALGTGGTVFPVPVIVQVPANAAPVQTAITANVGYAPAVAVTGPTTSIPTFAVSTTAPVNTATVTACSTTLLFPYVTNVAGFETGIAVANTTTDNLGKANASTATPINGSCVFNFYGNTATQPPAFTAPPTPALLGVTTAGAPTNAPVYANTLTAMSGATNFTGYAIASCNFLEAHGFGFITDISGPGAGFSGTMGYLAVVIPNGRGEGTPTLAGTTSLTNQ